MVSHTQCFGRHVRTVLTAAAFVTAPFLLGMASSANAQQAIYTPGEPIVTGFSGVAPPGSPPSTGSPLDTTFIDLAGNSMVIQQLQPAGPPTGQLLQTQPVFSAKAKDVGQVFGIALDDAPDTQGAAAPNIYLTATSAFGLDVVVPDASGQPVRSKLGAAGATFMPGQWGSAGGATGSPGSIWKVDGTTGEITLFSTIAADSGAGLGDIVFDPSTQQFFVSDLDTGLIYRLDATGTIIDSFDHGVAGRPAHALAPVADDGSEVDITNPAFSSEDPKTWGFTQPERKVNGLAVYGGRLYYAVADGPSIWSVGINPDGSFGDPRWELDVTGLPSTNEITNILFDSEGRMTVAQRGPQVGSYDYSVFAEPKTSSVVRYTHEFPDDPTTPSTWVQTPETYAIGFPPAGNNASGGIAFGPGYDPTAQAFGGAGQYLWSTGDSLRDASGITPALTPPLDPPAQVAGLQGNDSGLVRPQNDPPTQSFFTDYDGNTGDDQAQNQGHVGDVEIWQAGEGGGGRIATGGNPPGFVPPPYLPPPGYVPPKNFNLTLTKWATPQYCKDIGNDWFCGFTIRVRNTGSTPYWGPVAVDDWLPDNNPGAQMKFFFQPPWNCTQTGSTAYECATGPKLLFPGDSIDLHEVVKLPQNATNKAICELENAASIRWFFNHDDNPADDFDAATALIKSQQCPPTTDTRTDLKLQKIAFPKTCQDGGTEWLCDFYIKVTNLGPGKFSGPIKVTDTLGLNEPATFAGPWTCSQSGVNITCDINTPPVNALPGWHSIFEVIAHVNKATDGNPVCELGNKADIASPPGGPADPKNFNAANDHAATFATVPDRRCDNVPTPKTDIKITKVPTGCVASAVAVGYSCGWVVTIVNLGPDPYTGPLSWEDQATGANGNSLTLLPVCAGAASDVTCTAPANVTLAPNAPVNLPFVTTYGRGADQLCTVTNTATILQPVPGSASNPSGNDTQTVTQDLPNPACLKRVLITTPQNQCPTDQIKPGGCCDTGTVWNGRECATPRPPRKPPVSTGPTCPSDSHVLRGECVCDTGTHGTPGNCQPNVTITTPLPGPICPSDSHILRGRCVCDTGTHGTPGSCQKDIVIKPLPGPICPSDSHVLRGHCVCNTGTQGDPGHCKAPSNGPIVKLPPRTLSIACPADSIGSHMPDCTCRRGTTGTPGHCVATTLKLNRGVLLDNNNGPARLR